MAGVLPALGIGSTGGSGGTFSDITGAIGDIGNFFIDQKGSSSGTTTTSIDKVGMEYLLNQLLGSNQGLAATLSGGMGAGVYNSPTQGLLANDLVARMLGEVAARNTTVVNEASTKKDAPLDGLLGGGIGGTVGDLVTASFGGKKVLGTADKVLTGGLAGKAVKSVKKKLKKLF